MLVYPLGEKFQYLGTSPRDTFTYEQGFPWALEGSFKIEKKIPLKKTTFDMK